MLWGSSQGDLEKSLVPADLLQWLVEWKRQPSLLEFLPGQGPGIPPTPALSRSPRLWDKAEGVQTKHSLEWTHSQIPGYSVPTETSRQSPGAGAERWVMAFSGRRLLWGRESSVFTPALSKQAIT